MLNNYKYTEVKKVEFCIFFLFFSSIKENLLFQENVQIVKNSDTIPWNFYKHGPFFWFYLHYLTLFISVPLVSFLIKMFLVFSISLLSRIKKIPTDGKHENFT